jgi:cation transport ATPase
MMRIRRYPIAILAAAGLLAGLVAQLVFRSPDIASRVFLVTQLAGGAPLVVRTVRGLLRGHFAADVVAMLAIVGAAALGHYFAGAVIVLMQSGGEALEAFAQGRAAASLEALLARAPRIAHREHQGILTDVDVNDVRPGDVLVVKPGELIPVDGTVSEGTSSLDLAALTGES